MQIVTIKQLAKDTETPEATIYYWAKNRIIPCEKFLGRYFIKKSDLPEIIEKISSHKKFSLSNKRVK